MTSAHAADVSSWLATGTLTIFILVLLWSCSSIIRTIIRMKRLVSRFEDALFDFKSAVSDVRLNAGAADTLSAIGNEVERFQRIRMSS